MSLYKEFLDRVDMMINPPPPREVSILMTFHESGDGGLILETDQDSCQKQLSQRVRELPVTQRYTVRVMERWSFLGGWKRDNIIWSDVPRLRFSVPTPPQDKVLVTSDTL